MCVLPSTVVTTAIQYIANVTPDSVIPLRRVTKWYKDIILVVEKRILQLNVPVRYFVHSTDTSFELAELRIVVLSKLSRIDPIKIQVIIVLHYFHVISTNHT